MKWHIFTEDQRRAPAPTFRLPTNQGGTFSVDDERQWGNLVLFFAHGKDCSACRDALNELAARRVQYAALETKIVPVLPDGATALAGLAYPFPVLADPQGVARQRYAGLVDGEDGHVMFFVLDRFGAPYAAVTLPEPNDPELHGEIQEWLDFIEVQCPE